ncbi:MAG: hypothetical protein A3F12_02015 [Gammaproteobacteria bacterium RIFCSPHIGHO2_12_FULL_38_14]|nr:MAG: hypothetical protein A3F12_02015 [Gammaproteobacteria bacterium RIFCSPHIGHO2_12_FULL_38_14]
MNTFSYAARDKHGALIKGKMQAHDANYVADQLIKDNLIPIQIRAIQKIKLFSRPVLNWTLPNITLFGTAVSNETLTIFCRQMYSLTKAGIPIVSAIQRLSEITPNVTLATTLKAIFKEILLGTSLSKAMQHYPKIFSLMLVSLVMSAEANGRLDEAFMQAAKHYALENISKRRIKMALRYPILVIIFAFVAVMLMNVFVIPKFAQLYSSFHTLLPLPTRMLIGFSNFVNRFWWLIACIILMMAVLIYYCLHHPIFSIAIDRMKMHIPIFGSIIERVIMANFSSNLAMLLKTGVTLIESLKLVADVVDNRYAKEKILAMRAFIEHGKNLSQAANAVRFFSPLILQMLQVGEETGNIDTMLLEASEFYEREVDYDIKQLTDKIEPILLVIVGVIVLVLALGVFLPMWNLANAVH